MYKAVIEGNQIVAYKADFVDSQGRPVRWNARGGEAIAGNLGRNDSGQFTNVSSSSGRPSKLEQLVDSKRKRPKPKKPEKQSGRASASKKPTEAERRAEIDKTGADGIEKLGYDKSEYANMTDISDNVPADDPKFKKLLDDGLAEVVDGKVVLTGTGKSVLNAVQNGKVGNAKEIIARNNQRRADDEKRRADDEKRQADANQRRADDEKRQADAKKKPAGGGGGKKPAKPDKQEKPVDKSVQQADAMVSAVRQIDEFIARNADLPADDPNKLTPKERKQLIEKRTEYEAGIKDLTNQSYAKYAVQTDKRTIELLKKEGTSLRKKLADKTLSKAVRKRYQTQMRLINREFSKVKERLGSASQKEKRPWPRNKMRWQEIYNQVQKRNPRMSASQVHAVANDRYSQAGGQWHTIDIPERKSASTRYKKTVKAFPFSAVQRRRFMVSLKHGKHDQSSHGKRGAGGGGGLAPAVMGARPKPSNTEDMFGDSVPRVPSKGKFVPLKGDQVDMFGDTVPTTADLIPKGDAPKKPTFADSRIPTDGKAKQILGDSVDRDGNADPNGYIPITRHPKTPQFPAQYDLMDAKTRGIVDHVVKEGFDGVPYTREQAAQRVAQIQTEHRDYWHTGNDILGENYQRTQQGLDTRENFVWNRRETQKFTNLEHHDEKFQNINGIGSTNRATGRLRFEDVRRVDLAPAYRKAIYDRFGAQANNLENSAVIQATAAMQLWHQKKYDRVYKRLDMELARSTQSEDVFGGTGATQGARDYNNLMASWHMGRYTYLDAKADTVRLDSVEALSPIKTRTAQKHGKHDQSSHGRRGSRGASFAGAYRFARQGGASVAEARAFAKESSQLEGDRLRAERDAKRPPKTPTIASAQRALRDADAYVVSSRAALDKAERRLGQLENDPKTTPRELDQARQNAVNAQKYLDTAEQRRIDAAAEVQARRDARNQPAPAPAPTTTATPAPTPAREYVAPDGKIGLAGRPTEAFGLNPRDKYQFTHRIVDMADLQASNTLAGGINPNYDPALQPRDRSRASSQAQIDKLAGRMIPEYMTEDMRRIDTGSPIIDANGNVLSGNGRLIAMQRQIDTPGTYPGKADAMRAEAIRRAEELGIDPAAVRDMKNPVVVRLLDDPNIDPVAFAKEANASTTLRMSPMEQARVDAMDLPADFGTRMDTGDGSSIDLALRNKANKPLIDEFIGTIPENERGGILTAEGGLNPMGLYRLKAAIFTQTFPTEEGQRMARSLLDSVEPDLVSVQTGIAGALPVLSKAAGQTRTGARGAHLDPTGDIATTVDTLARVRSYGPFADIKPANRVDVFLEQANAFTGDTRADKPVVISLTPQQKVLLKHINGIASKPRIVKSFFGEIARLIDESAAPGQGGLFGGDPSQDFTLEDIYNRAYRSATTRGE
jgi:hypothetical protein